MTFCWACRKCGHTAETEQNVLGPECGRHAPPVPMDRDYRAETLHLSVKARPTATKDHRGKAVSR